MSAEADIYPLQAPELAEKIEGAIGEGSQLHQTFGYHAQGVGPDTAVLPRGWMSRVHRVQSAATNHRVGYCLDLLDLFMSKAAREAPQLSSSTTASGPSPAVATTPDPASESAG